MSIPGQMSGSVAIDEAKCERARRRANGSELVPGAELEEKIGRLIGWQPEQQYAATRDDGKSFVYGPFADRRKIENFLTGLGGGHAYEVVAVPAWPGFSTDSGAAMAAVEKFDPFEFTLTRTANRKWHCTMSRTANHGTSQNRNRVNTHEVTAPLVICRAIMLLGRLEE